MVEDRIGYRYAKSIFDLAKEKGMLEEVRDDMALVHETCEVSREFVLMLKSPLIPVMKKQTILKKIFADKFKEDFTKLLLEILVRKGREQYLDFVAKSFLLLYDREKHISRGTLTSAAPLSDDQIAQIRKLVEKRTGDTLELEIEVNPELIGGFILKIGDTLFDGSISTSLRRIDQDFKKNTYIKLF